MNFRSSFCNTAKNVISKLDDFKNALTFILDEINESGHTSLQLESLQNFEPLLQQYLEITNEGLCSINNLISDRIPRIEWIPGRKFLMEMTWETGITPWSFWLKYKNHSTEINKIINSIKKKWSEGELEKEPSPTLGMYVLICSKRRTYRGVISSIGSKIQVTNVDDGKEREELLDSCFKLTNELCAVHANVIRCSIGRVDIEKSWKTEYSQDFVSLLQYSRLSVKVLDKITNTVPTYLIDLYAINEDSENEISVNEWISEKCVETTKTTHEDNINENNNSPTSSKDEVSNRLLKLAKTVNPDCKPITIKNEFPESAVNMPFKFETVVHVPEFSPNIKSKKEKLENDTALEGHGDCKSIKTDKVLSSLACGFKEIPTNSSVELALSTLTNGSINKENEVSNRFLKVAESVKSVCKNVTPKKELLPIKAKEPFKFESVIDAPEFLPINASKKAPDLNRENIGKMNGFHEISAMPGNYNPKDEDRICSFYTRKGYCWKVGCNKEHVEANDKWTNDQEDIYSTTTFALPRLPKNGADLKVNVTHVTSPNTFYVHLPDTYTVNDGHTLDHLLSDLNKKEYHKEMAILTSPPSFGEFLVAYSAKKKQWLRGNVYDICGDDEIQVFFVDYGMTEDVCLDKLRKILPQFNHLPSQAVFCVLSKVEVKNMEEEEIIKAINFMESYLLNKTIDIKIMDSEIDDNKLEVVAKLNDVNINELVVRKGFCSPF